MSSPSGAPRWPAGRVVGGLLALALVTGGAVLASRPAGPAGPADARDAPAPAVPAAPSAPPPAEVVNAGFDAQPLPDGALTLGSPTGWSGAVVLLNPDGTRYSALAGGRSRTGSMDGSNVLSLLGLLGREAVQTTPTVALPGVSYTLTVAVGGRDRGTFAGVTVALLAGGVPVRVQEVSRPPVRGGFGDVTLSWTAGQAEAGRRLGIRLGLTRVPDAATGAGRGAGQDAGYADLDHVRLSATGTGRPVTGLAVTAPVERQVLQRGPDGLAAVPVRVLAPPGGRVQARLVPRAGARGRGTGWAGLPAGPGGTGERVEGVLPGVPAGWYDLQVRLLDAAGAEIAGRTVQRVGVGEVFVTAGQSNAANHGIRPQTPLSDQVSAPAAGYGGWRHAADPQPNATGRLGSPWPAFGDRLAQDTGVPVGVVAVGFGSTLVGQWQPGGTLYSRLQQALAELGPHGLRAVLWHQGESDAAACTSSAGYLAGLTSLVAASRRDAGFAVPWGIATAATLPTVRPACAQAVRAAQERARATVPGTFPGPDTDGYRSAGLTWDGAHLGEAGLRRHGEAWAVAVEQRAGLPD